MALDFPSNPSTGTVYYGTNDVTYTFDGVKWLGQAQKGSQGFQGVQGSQGFQGVQGSQGFQGVQGSQGFQGVQGSQGFQGIQGSQGFQGFQGVQGSQGYQGFQGVQGSQGFQGESGLDIVIQSGTGTQVTQSYNTWTVWTTADLQTVTDYGNVTNNTISINNNTESTSTSSGALIVNGGVGIGGNLSLGKTLTINQVQESVVTITSATGIVNHDASLSRVFNHTNILGTFTVNVTNLSLNTGYSTILVLLLNQTSSAYIPTEFRINGNPQNINWQAGIIPSGVENGIDVVSYTLINTTNINSCTVLGQLVSFG
jgi:hypothetical protein